ncbi:MAG: hydroxymethylglutaryl-CoA synthase [Chloroflexota bacterium]|nr:hydroxymethylglutaryl-CoA synthase [Chloroflexota bacterium]
MGAMRPLREVGIVGYGAYIPRYRLPAAEVARVWQGREASDVPIQEKAVPGLDEDTATMAIEAARNGLARAQVDPSEIGAVWVGSESHPYAVKPTSTIVAQAIGAMPHVLAADWEFACKAGTEAIQAAMGLVGSGMADYALCIGADAAQGRPGDELEYTAGAGAAAFLIGPAEESAVRIEGSTSYSTDTPDFFRRPGQRYPQHAGRFTGEPAYFHHIESAARHLLEELEAEPADFAHAVFHQPNVKFPRRAAKGLGFTVEQIELGMLVDEIGNAYAGSSLLGLTAVLDVAQPGERVFLVSFGSGAGSDAFSLLVTDLIEERRSRAPLTRDYIARRVAIDYATYARYRRKLSVH